MSTRQLLNMTMGAFAMLLLAAIGIVFSTTGNQGDQNTRIDLAVRQQVLIQDLTRETAALTDAGDRESVAAARQDLARTIVVFDRNLTALLHGGQAVDANGQTVVVNRTHNDMARIALEDGAHLWAETGLPLSDLTAGEFSVFSAAGQKAVNGLQSNNVELMQQMGTAANALRMSLHARGAIAGIAQWAAAGLAVILIGLGFFRRKLIAPADTAPAARRKTPATSEAVYADLVATDRNVAPPGLPGAAPELGSYASPVDFDSVNASVDQMSVDMNTIAGSTDKMRLAIDSVGHALQGMLYSLNEMAQDTAEGHKIVRNANNAASFTADTAGDLAASAREMSAVVARVTQLAKKTQQVATQIDGEAVHTGKTGEAFTSVVAGEVKGLSRQTNRATREIEDTVAGILATARQYEEAIGQIIKNISAINKVSENLGELMLSPPAHVQPGPPLPVAPALTPPPVAAAPQPTPAPVSAAPAPAATPTPAEPVAAVPEPEPVPDPAPAEPITDDPVVTEASPAEVAAETATAIEETAETVEPDSGSNGNVFMLGGRPKKTNALNIPQVEAAAEPVPEPPVASEPAPEPEPAETEAPAPKGGSNGNVFMLGGPKKKAPAAEPVEPAVPEVAATPEPEAAAAPATEAPAADDGSGKNVFMLNKPKTTAKPESTPAESQPAAPEPETAAAETTAEAPAETPAETPTEAPAETPAEAPVEAPAEAPVEAPAEAALPAFSGPNIYGLELPEAVVATSEDVSEPAAAEVPETVPATDEEPKDDSADNANIFMLNKPK